MSLVRLSKLVLVASFAGAVVMIVAGAIFFTRLTAAQGELDDLLALQRDIGALSVAADTLVLYRASPAMYDAVRRDAAAVGRRLDDLAARHPDGRSGVVAVELMVELIDEMAATRAEDVGAGTQGGVGHGPLGLSLREQTLLTQMAAHGVALDAATAEAAESLRREVAHQGRRIATIFGGGAVAFAVLSASAFGVLNRRVTAPVARLARTVRAVEAGDTTARAPAGRRDEIGELGRSFNAMIDGLEATLERLRRSEAVLRVAGDVARLGGWRWEVGADHVLWSDETARILDEPPGFRPSLDRAFAYFAEADRPRLAARFDACARNGERYDLVVRAVTATGRAIEARAVGEPERDETGRIVAVQGAFQDVTEQRAREARLHQAEKLETVGQLTGGVAHDFNNLLTIILGNAELMEDTAPDVETRESARLIVQAGERGAELTRNLLAFSRRQALEPRPTDLHAFILENQRLLSRGVHEGIEIVFNLAADDPVAVVDPNKLQAALLNLIVNSRHAIGAHGKIVVETTNATLDEAYAARHAEVVPGDYLAVAVSDDGAGMPPEVMAQAFEPFFTTKETGTGTGLGLSSVYGFAKQSGGHAKIYSEPGLGTSVKLYLPRAGEANRAELRPDAAAPVRGGGEHVVVVEDDPALRAHAKAQIERLGYRVSVAGDAAEALALIDAHPDVALLFTDVVMPGEMNGRELAEAARARRPELKVLYTSGYTKNAIVHHGRLDPDVELLSKPYRLGDLAERLATILGRADA